MLLEELDDVLRSNGAVDHILEAAGLPLLQRAVLPETVRKVV
jgi:hypothetical protein